MTVHVQLRGRVLVVTIDRPERRNAVDAATAAELERQWLRLDADDDVRVGILTGAGGHFSGGMDLQAFTDGQSPVTARGFGGLTGAPPRKPLIAAVEGHAAGGGFEMVLACDLVVASTTARFALPEVRRGLIAGAGGLLRLPARLPQNLAMQLSLTGEPLTGADAHRYGLVTVLTEPGQALPAALELADRIGSGAPLAVQASKAVVRAVGDAPDRAAELQTTVGAGLFDSADAREGALAFLEKRPPQWVGR
jgi:enoyl-CoA hydratase